MYKPFKQESFASRRVGKGGYGRLRRDFDADPRPYRQDHQVEEKEKRNRVYLLT